MRSRSPTGRLAILAAFYANRLTVHRDTIASNRGMLRVVLINHRSASGGSKSRGRSPGVVVSGDAIRELEAFDFMLGDGAVEYRRLRYQDRRLSQVADYVSSVELAAMRYAAFPPWLASLVAANRGHVSDTM